MKHLQQLLEDFKPFTRKTCPSFLNNTIQYNFTFRGKSIGNFIGRFAFLMGVVGCMLSIAAIALGIGPDTPKILNVVPKSGEMSHTAKSSASTLAE